MVQHEARRDTTIYYDLVVSIARLGCFMELFAQ